MPDHRGAELTDTHCHLNHPRLLRRLVDVLARAREAGVSDMIVVGYDLPSSRAAVELAGQHDGLWATVGIHPHDAGAVNGSALAEIRSLARSPKVVAIGETGLDFYRDLSPREAQVDSFRRHLDLAAALSLPAIIHCRDAQDEVLAMIASHPQPNLVWHCFDGTIEQAERAVSLGMALGFGGTVTRRGAEGLRQAAQWAPADRILLETDAPYLAPEPYRSRDNEPANVVLVAEAVAAARGESAASIAALTSGNARRMFGLGDGVR
jgi:TatD DNase family protein